jgi:drug/metabolite transporter (DMT)-like permease
MSPIKRGRVLVLAAAFCWSTGGAAVKNALPLNVWQIAGLRSLVAFFFVGALVGIWNARPLFPSGRVLLGSLANAGMLILYIAANLRTTSANAIFLQCTAPLWVLLLAPIVLKEPFRAQDLRIFSLCGVGMVLFFCDRLSGGEMLGNVLALLSGVCYAMVVLGLRWGNRKLSDEAASERKGPNDAQAIVVWGNLLCFLICAPLMGSMDTLSARPLMVVTGMGVIQLGLGYYFLSLGTAHVSALESILLALIEPMLNPLWAFIFLNERPGPWALAGGTLVIGTVAYQTVRDGLRPKPAVAAVSVEPAEPS